MVLPTTVLGCAKVAFAILLFIPNFSAAKTSSLNQFDRSAVSAECHGAAPTDIKVRTIDDLRLLDQHLDEGEVAHLCNDIDFSARPTFEPLIDKLRGALLGHGHKLHNINVIANGSHPFLGRKCALINEIQEVGSVQDLRIEGMRVSGALDYVEVAPLAIYNFGWVDRVTVQNVVVEGVGGAIGGLVIQNHGTISNVQVTGSLFAQHATTISGIVESNYNGILYNVSFSGSLRGKLVSGITTALRGGSLRYAKVAAEITCDKFYCGGVVGVTHFHAQIEDVSFEGSIDCGPGASCGGIVSNLFSGHIKRAAARLSISGMDSNFLGGIAARDEQFINRNSVTDSYVQGSIEARCSYMGYCGDPESCGYGGVSATLRGDYKRAYSAVNLSTDGCHFVPQGVFAGYRAPTASTFRLYYIPEISSVTSSAAGAAVTMQQATMPSLWQSAGFSTEIWRLPTAGVPGLPTLTWED